MALLAHNLGARVRGRAAPAYGRSRGGEACCERIVVRGVLGSPLIKFALDRFRRQMDEPGAVNFTRQKR